MKIKNITIKKDLNDTNIVATTVVNYRDYNIPFRFVNSSDFTSDILAEDFRSAFWEYVETVRKNAYAQGWSDAKRKKPKATKFSGNADPTLSNVGWAE